MAHQSRLIATDIESYLQAHQERTLLRFTTCGSVGDGKSTLQKMFGGIAWMERGNLVVGLMAEGSMSDLDAIIVRCAPEETSKVLQESGVRPFEHDPDPSPIGQSLQREMLQKQLARFSDNGSITSSHGEDAAPQLEPTPPQEDRAG